MATITMDRAITTSESYPSSPTRIDSKIAATNNKARAITIAEYKEAAHALAEAFSDDEVSRYFLDTPDRAHWTDKEKWDLHVSIMEYITYAHCLRGLVVVAGDNYGSVALWMPPGNNMDDWYTILRSGMWRLRYQLSAEGRTRFFEEFLPLLHDTKHAVLGPRDDTSYYLVYVGTRPSARGKGLAKKCIGFVTDRADEEGRACYLESSNDINPIIYGKLGFEIVKKIALKRAAEEVVLDIMVREPVGAPAAQNEKNKEEVITEALPSNLKLQVSAGNTEKTLKAFAVVKTSGEVTDKLSCVI